MVVAMQRITGSRFSTISFSPFTFPRTTSCWRTPRTLHVIDNTEGEKSSKEEDPKKWCCVSYRAVQKAIRGQSRRENWNPCLLPSFTCVAYPLSLTRRAFSQAMFASSSLCLTVSSSSPSIEKKSKKEKKKKMQEAKASHTVSSSLKKKTKKGSRFLACPSQEEESSKGEGGAAIDLLPVDVLYDVLRGRKKKSELHSSSPSFHDIADNVKKKAASSSGVMRTLHSVPPSPPTSVSRTSSFSFFDGDPFPDGDSAKRNELTLLSHAAKISISSRSPRSSDCRTGGTPRTRNAAMVAASPMKQDVPSRDNRTTSKEKTSGTGSTAFSSLSKTWRNGSRFSRRSGGKEEKQSMRREGAMTATHQRKAREWRTAYRSSSHSLLQCVRIILGGSTHFTAAAVATEEILPPPSLRSLPSPMPVEEQDWYADLISHMEYCLSALQDAVHSSSSIAASSSTISDGVGKGQTVSLSIEAMLEHALQEVELWPLGVPLPWNTTSPISVLSESGTDRAVTENRTTGSRDHSASPLFQRVCSHPPEFFMAMLGSALSFLQRHVWEEYKAQRAIRRRDSKISASSTLPHTFSLTLLGPSSSRRDFTPPFSISTQTEVNPSVAATAEQKQDASRTSHSFLHRSSPSFDSGEEGEGDPKWNVVLQRVEHGTKAYERLIRRLVRQPAPTTHRLGTTNRDEDPHKGQEEEVLTDFTSSGVDVGFSAASPPSSTSFSLEQKKEDTDKLSITERAHQTKHRLREVLERLDTYLLGWWNTMTLPLLPFLLSTLPTSRSIRAPMAADGFLFHAQDNEEGWKWKVHCRTAVQAVQHRQKTLLRRLLEQQGRSSCMTSLSDVSSSVSHSAVGGTPKTMEEGSSEREGPDAIWKHWASFQRARAATRSLQSLLNEDHRGSTVVRKEGSPLSSTVGNFGATSEVEEVISIVCTIAWGRLLQYWEWYAKAVGGGTSRFPVQESTHTLQGVVGGEEADGKHVSADDAITMKVAWHIKEGRSSPLSSRPGDAAASGGSPCLSASPFSLFQRLHEVLREDVMKQLEQLQPYIVSMLPFSKQPTAWSTAGKTEGSGTESSSTSRMHSTPPICHRTIHTSLNLLLATLCQDPEYLGKCAPAITSTPCQKEEERSSKKRASMLETTAGERRKAGTMKTDEMDAVSSAPLSERGIWRRGGTRKRVDSVPVSQLEVRWYALQRVSDLLKTLRFVFFYSGSSSVPAVGPSFSSMQEFTGPRSAMLGAPIPRPPLWVLSLYSRLVRMGLEMERANSFHVYAHFQLAPYTAIDPVSAFVEEETQWLQPFGDIRLIPFMRAWPASMAGKKHPKPSRNDARCLAPATANTGITSSSPSSDRSSFALLDCALEEEQREEERAKEREEGFLEWYIPSALIACCLQLRVGCTQFIYEALLFWCSMEAGVKSHQLQQRDVSSRGSSLFAEENNAKRTEEDEELRERRTGVEKGSPQEKEAEERHRIHLFLGRFEHSFNALLRRQYLFGAQERELLSRWRWQEVEEASPPPRHHSETSSMEHTIVDATTIEKNPPPLLSKDNNVSDVERREAEEEEQERMNTTVDDDYMCHGSGGISSDAPLPLLSPRTVSRMASPLSTSFPDVSLWKTLQRIIASFPLRAWVQEVYRDVLQSFLWIREVHTSFSTSSFSGTSPPRSLGKSSYFTACGISLPQAMEVAYFLVLCEQRWPHMFPRAPSLLTSHPLPSPGMKTEKEVGGEEEEEEEEEAAFVVATTSAIQDYAHEVLLTLEHSTAKQLWHLRCGGRGMTRSHTSSTTPPHHLQEDEKDGVDSSTSSSSTSTSDTAHSVLFHFTGEDRHHVYLQDPALRRRHAQSVLSVVHAHVMHPSLLWAPLWLVQELFIVLDYCKTALRVKPVKAEEGRQAAHTDYEAMEEENNEEEEVLPVVVVGKYQSNLSLFHGYLVLRMYVISNVLRTLRRAWVDRLCSSQEAILRSPSPTRGGEDILASTKLPSIERKLQALWRLEAMEPERERVESPLVGDTHRQPSSSSTGSSSPSRRPRTWAMEMVKDLLLQGSSSSSSFSAAASTTESPTALPSALSLRSLAARVEGLYDDAWGAIRSIQRLEKTIQMAAKRRLLFHVLHDRQQRWRTVEEEEWRRSQRRPVSHKSPPAPSTLPPPSVMSALEGDGEQNAAATQRLVSSSLGVNGTGVSFGEAVTGVPTTCSPSCSLHTLSLDEILWLTIHRPDAKAPMGFALNASTGRILRVQPCRVEEQWKGGEGEDKKDGRGSALSSHYHSVPAVGIPLSSAMDSTWNHTRTPPSSTAEDGEKGTKGDEMKEDQEVKDALTPIAAAVRAANITPLRRIIGYYVTAVDHMEVENGKQVAQLIAGKTSFRLRLEKSRKQKTKKNSER